MTEATPHIFRSETVENTDDQIRLLAARITEQYKPVYASSPGVLTYVAELVKDMLPREVAES